MERFTDDPCNDHVAKGFHSDAAREGKYFTEVEVVGGSPPFTITIHHMDTLKSELALV